MERDADRCAPIHFMFVHKGIVAFAIFFLVIILFADRYNISIAIIQMKEMFGYTAAQQSQIHASFYYGYIVTQALSGYVSSPGSTLGPKRVLTMSVVCCALVTTFLPFAAQTSLGLLMTGRVILGMAEGMCMPAIVGLIALWFPLGERATVTSLVNVAKLTGIVAVVCLAPVAAINWKFIFFLFAFLGFIWVFLFYILIRDEPQHPLTPAALAETHLLNGRRLPDSHYESISNQGSQIDITYDMILTQPAFWSIGAMHFAYSWAMFITDSWLPTYIVVDLARDAKEVGGYAWWPYVAGTFTGLTWGYLIDQAVMRGWLRLWFARWLSQAVSSVGSILAWFMLIHSVTIFQKMFFLTAATACLQTTGFYANIIDVGGLHAATKTTAMSTTIGSLSGIFGNIVVGLFLDGLGGGWNAVFISMMVMQAIALGMFTLFGQVTRYNFMEDKRSALGRNSV